MVLRAGLCLIVALFVPLASAVEFDPSAFDKAMTLYKKKEYAQTADLLQRNYDWKSAPLKVSGLAVLALARVEHWDKLRAIVDQTLRGRVDWWPPKDGNAPEVGEKMKSVPKGIWQLMFLAADAGVKTFADRYDDLTEAQRAQIKSEVKLYADALSQTDFQPEKVMALTSQLQEHEDVEAKSEFKWHANVELSYWTWEDRMIFSVNSSAESTHAEVFSPCLGGNAEYSNAYYQVLLGACAGLGKASVSFQDGKYDNNGKVTMIDGYGGLLKTIGDGGAGVGLEAHLLERSMNAISGSNVRASADDQDLAVLAVGRFHFWKLDLKFKGGAMISNPSAVWQAELSIPVY